MIRNRCCFWARVVETNVKSKRRFPSVLELDDAFSKDGMDPYIALIMSSIPFPILIGADLVRVPAWRGR